MEDVTDEAEMEIENGTEKLNKYKNLDEEVEGYVSEISKFVSQLDDPNKRKNIDADDFQKIFAKKEEYENKTNEDSEEYIGSLLDEIYEGEIWENIEDLEDEFGSIPTTEDFEKLKEEMNETKENLNEKKTEYSSDIEDLDEIYNKRKDILEYERDLENLLEEKGLSEDEAREIYEKKQTIEEIEDKITEKKKKFKKIKESDDEDYEDEEGGLLDDLQEVAEDLSDLKGKRDEIEEPTKNFEINQDTVEKIYDLKNTITQKYSEYEEEFSDLEEDEEEKVSDLLATYDSLLEKRGDLEKMRSPYVSARKILDGIEKDEDGEVVYKLEEELKNKLGELSEKLDDNEVRKDMIKAGWESYEDSEDINLVEMYEDYKELSIGSLMAMMSDEERYNFNDFEDIERLWQDYEEQRREKDLPGITPAMLAANVDFDTAKTDLINFNGINARIRGPGQLNQLYEHIDALEKEDGEISEEPSWLKKTAKKATVFGVATMLGLGVGISQAVANPNATVDFINGVPVVVHEEDVTHNITGSATDNISVSGTVQTTHESDMNLDADNLSGTVEIPTQEGNITITEQDGHLELATGNATIKLNETDANLTLNESTGELLFDGQLEGTSVEEFQSEFNGENEEIDADINSEFTETKRDVNSLLPYLFAGAGLGTIYVAAKERKNKELKDALEEKEIEDKYELGSLVREVDDKSQELQKEREEALIEMEKSMRDALRDINEGEDKEFEDL